MLCSSTVPEVPIVCHPGLKEVCKATVEDYTFNGKYPEGKPGAIGITKSALAKALETHPQGKRVELSELDEVWCDPFEKHSSMMERIQGMPAWLLARPESRIVVVTHGGPLKHLMKSKV